VSWKKRREIKDEFEGIGGNRVEKRDEWKVGDGVCRGNGWGGVDEILFLCGWIGDNLKAGISSELNDTAIR
jgi:hypothetical protein